MINRGYYLVGNIVLLNVFVIICLNFAFFHNFGFLMAHFTHTIAKNTYNLETTFV